MDLKNIIFHGIETEQHVAEVKIIERTEELILPSENAFQLICKARDSYNKDSGISYAEFGNGWFPDYLNKLLDNELNFLDLSIKGLQEIKKEMKTKPATTGGHLFFVRYNETGQDFFMTLLLKDLSGFTVEDLTISESHILNIDKLHFGARINITKWKNNDGTYISFLKGSGRREITDYFLDFLCIDDLTFNDSSRNTLNLISAIKTFCHDNCKSEEEISSVKERVKNELLNKIHSKEFVSLGAVSALVYPDEPSKFSEFVNESDYEVQAEFRPDKTKLRKLTRYSGRTRDLSISFDLDAIDDGTVVFEDKNETPRLIVNKIPPKLLADLKLNVTQSGK